MGRKVSEEKETYLESKRKLWKTNLALFNVLQNASNLLMTVPINELANPCVVCVGGGFNGQRISNFREREELEIYCAM